MPCFLSSWTTVSFTRWGYIKSDSSKNHSTAVSRGKWGLGASREGRARGDRVTWCRGCTGKKLMFPLRSFRSISLLRPPEVISLFPVSELNLMQESFCGCGVSTATVERKAEFGGEGFAIGRSDVIKRLNEVLLEMSAVVWRVQSTWIAFRDSVRTAQ